MEKVEFKVKLEIWGCGSIGREKFCFWGREES